MVKSKSLPPAVLDKSLDADFQTVMKHVGFLGTPREVVTVRDMQNRYAKLLLLGKYIKE